MYSDKGNHFADVTSGDPLSIDEVDAEERKVSMRIRFSLVCLLELNVYVKRFESFQYLPDVLTLLI